MTELSVHSARLADLDPVTLYRLIRLRIDVFVVEQACAYPELDGRELESDAWLVWAELGDAVVTTLRVLPEADGSVRIGRVAVASSARSAGYAGDLMRWTMAEIGPGVDIVLDAQSYLTGWYQRLGFVVAGAEFDEDGIAHTPMRRPA